jgi:[ribosomal protein S18]-alanine N-acetyltransferase
MVARPPVRLEIEPMRLPDLDAVREIEVRSFSTPWPAHAYPAEIETNRLAHYRVARLDGRIVAFAGIWLMLDEAHVTTFAVHPDFRRRSIGERLLLAMLDVAIANGAREATLEVRLSNVAARKLYEKYGFRPVGLRPRYYSDDNEDALIMTTEPLGEPAMQARVARLRAGLEAGRELDAGADDGEGDGPEPGPEDPTR